MPVHTDTTDSGMPVHTDTVCQYILQQMDDQIWRVKASGPFYITYYFYIAFYSGQSCDQNRGLLYKVPRYLLDSSKAYWLREIPKELARGRASKGAQSDERWIV